MELDRRTPLGQRRPWRWRCRCNRSAALEASERKRRRRRRKSFRYKFKASRRRWLANKMNGTGRARCNGRRAPAGPTRQIVRLSRRQQRGGGGRPARSESLVGVSRSSTAAAAAALHPRRAASRASEIMRATCDRTPLARPRGSKLRPQKGVVRSFGAAAQKPRTAVCTFRAYVQRARIASRPPVSHRATEIRTFWSRTCPNRTPVNNRARVRRSHSNGDIRRNWARRKRSKRATGPLDCDAGRQCDSLASKPAARLVVGRRGNGFKIFIPIVHAPLRRVLVRHRRESKLSTGRRLLVVNVSLNSARWSLARVCGLNSWPLRKTWPALGPTTTSGKMISGRKMEIIIRETTKHRQPTGDKQRPVLELSRRGRRRRSWARARRRRRGGGGGAMRGSAQVDGKLMIVARPLTKSGTIIRFGSLVPGGPCAGRAWSWALTPLEAQLEFAPRRGLKLIAPVGRWGSFELLQARRGAPVERPLASRRLIKRELHRPAQVRGKPMRGHHLREASGGPPAGIVSKQRDSRVNTTREGCTGSNRETHSRESANELLSCEPINQLVTPSEGDTTRKFEIRARPGRATRAAASETSATDGTEMRDNESQLAGRVDDANGARKSREPKLAQRPSGAKIIGRRRRADLDELVLAARGLQGEQARRRQRRQWWRRVNKVPKCQIGAGEPTMQMGRRADGCCLLGEAAAAAVASVTPLARPSSAIAIASEGRPAAGSIRPTRDGNQAATRPLENSWRRHRRAISNAPRAPNQSGPSGHDSTTPPEWAGNKSSSQAGPPGSLCNNNEAEGRDGTQVGSGEPGQARKLIKLSGGPSLYVGRAERAGRRPSSSRDYFYRCAGPPTPPSGGSEPVRAESPPPPPTHVEEERSFYCLGPAKRPPSGPSDAETPAKEKLDLLLAGSKVTVARLGLNENEPRLGRGRGRGRARKQVRHGNDAADGPTQFKPGKQPGELISFVTFLLFIIVSLVVGAGSGWPTSDSAGFVRLARAQHAPAARGQQSIMQADATLASGLGPSSFAAHWLLGRQLNGLHGPPAATGRGDASGRGGGGGTKTRPAIERSKVGPPKGPHARGALSHSTLASRARARLARRAAQQQFRLLQAKQERRARGRPGRIDKINLKRPPPPRRPRPVGAKRQRARAILARADKSTGPRRTKKWQTNGPRAVQRMEIENQLAADRLRELVIANTDGGHPTWRTGRRRRLLLSNDGPNNKEANFAHVIPSAARPAKAKRTPPRPDTSRPAWAATRRRRARHGRWATTSPTRKAIRGPLESGPDSGHARVSSSGGRRPAKPLERAHDKTAAKLDTNEEEADLRLAGRRKRSRENRLSVQLQASLPQTTNKLPPAARLRNQQMGVMRSPPELTMGRLVLAGHVPTNSSKGVECPLAWCQCTWKNGKQFADCSPGTRREQPTRMLRIIPDGLDPLLQVLNMSGNELGELPGAAFSSLNLNNLQRIYMVSCKLARVHLRAFEHLKLVVELDFARNQLDSIPLYQMRHLALLRRLSMRGNPLRALDEATLQGGPTPETQRTHTNTTETRHDDLIRLYETYPDLARALSRQATPMSSSSSSSSHEDERRQIELLGSIISELARRRKPSGALGFESSQADRADQPSLASDELGEPLTSLSPSLEFRDEATDSPADDERRAARSIWPSLGLFEHLQELDLGECQLSYIKWSTFVGLRSLKRLQLDGNQLSQLSGLLVAHLPVGLFELSLESNPWRCDCRLRDLRLWLGRTRTPLSAPARCSPAGPQAETLNDLDRQSLLLGDRAMRHEQLRRKPGRGTSAASGPAAKAGALETGAELEPKFLDRMEPDEFVCAPRVRARFWAKGRRRGEGERSLLSFVLGGFANSNELPDGDGDEIAQVRLPGGESETTVREGGNQISNLLQLSPEGGDGGDKPEERTDSTSSDAEQGQTLKINQVVEYLEETLVAGRQQAPAGKQVAPSEGTFLLAKQQHTTTQRSVTEQRRRLAATHELRPAEDERVTLRCAFLAYPSTSVDVLWLADHSAAPAVNHHQPPGAEQIDDNAKASVRDEAANRGKPAAKSSYGLLYDSRLHRTLDGNLSSSASTDRGENEISRATGTPGSSYVDEFFNEPEAGNALGMDWNEIPLYDSRLLVRESQSYMPTRIEHSKDELANQPGGKWPPASAMVLRESQLTIRAARLEDSARYKCVAVNEAGVDWLEFGVRVSPGATAASGQIPRDRDQAGPQGGRQLELSRRKNNKDQTDAEAEEEQTEAELAGQTRDQRANGSSSEQPPAQQAQQTQDAQQQQPQPQPPIGRKGPAPQTPTPTLRFQAGAKRAQTGQSQAAPTTTTMTSTAMRPTGNQASANWFKTTAASPAFQVFLVVASCLMGLVILAFVVFCIIIYQIKPSLDGSQASPFNLSGSERGELYEADEQLRRRAPPRAGGAAAEGFYAKQFHQRQAMQNQQPIEQRELIIAGQAPQGRLLVANPIGPLAVPNGYAAGGFAQHAKLIDFYGPHAGLMQAAGQQQFNCALAAPNHQQQQKLLLQQQQQQQLHLQQYESQRHLTAVCDPKTGRALESRIEWAGALGLGSAGTSANNTNTNQSTSTPPTERGAATNGNPTSSPSVSAGGDSLDQFAMALNQVPHQAYEANQLQQIMVLPGTHVVAAGPFPRGEDDEQSTREACL
ncbi:Leucine-rich repeat-containing protein 26 [Olea europaea subsp. europaea]|uniref:Leucine-rich repeat-containing protein 26 n=1 Tax=Olea europaea subsp. europaea TaxID=158383 RepID=A0A8S0TNL5_OLEEU|nr:Leucine-rich repeat-containing protein 26 [Olea europaea subsp. europaea]